MQAELRLLPGEKGTIEVKGAKGRASSKVGARIGSERPLGVFPSFGVVESMLGVEDREAQSGRPHSRLP